MKDFYSSLPTLDRFEEVARPQNFVPAPVGWHVLISDVRGSTRAISEGRYKDVNLIGASCIAAVLNACKGTDIPFVFGGDGATLLVPDELLEAAKQALDATRQMSRAQFQLELRVGAVSVSQLKKLGQEVRVAKLRVSESYVQAAFHGGGLMTAEKLIKSPEGSRYWVEEDPRSQASYQGLECRWQEIPSSRGEVHSILIQSLLSEVASASLYAAIFRRVQEIYGQSQSPANLMNLKLSTALEGYLNEAKIRASGREGLYRWMNAVITWLACTFFAPFINRGCKLGRDWQKYKDELLANTDFRKFDEMLRMVLSGSTEQRRELRAFLEGLRNEGKIAYGIHASSTALMTCLVFERNGNHFHFVDGNDGGYAEAARMLKEQLGAARKAKIA